MKRSLLIGFALSLPLVGLALPAEAAQASPSVFVTVFDSLPGRVYPLAMASTGAISQRSPGYYNTAGSSFFSTDVAVSPGGGHIYVSLEPENSGNPGAIEQFTVGSDGSLTALSPATVTAGGTYAPSAVVVSPNANSVYALEQRPSNSNSDAIRQWTVGGGGALTPKSPEWATAPGAGDLVLTPNGHNAYVSNFGYPGQIQEYSAGSLGVLSAVGSPTATDNFPIGMAVTPNGQYLYVGTDGSPLYVDQFKIGAGGALSPLSPASVPLPAKTYPESLATSPNGHNLYVGDQEGGNGVVQFSISSTGTLSPLSPAHVGTQQIDQLQLSPDGRNLYATTYKPGNTIRYTVGSGGAVTPTSSVGTGQSSEGIAVTPDQGPTASFTDVPAAAGKTTTFNGSGSHDPDGTVVSYAWSFGDGHSATTSTASVSHVYATKGTYTVTLRVTDNSGTSTSMVFTGHQVLREGGPAAQTQHGVTIP